MVYDLIVVGNGLASQTFLFELFNDVKKSQNFSVAQIFSEDIAPSCSLRSTATVSPNGIEEGISELGDELKKAYEMFVEFNEKNHPRGVEKVDRFVAFTTEKEKAKMIRRYKSIDHLTHPLIKEDFLGKKVPSYLVSPELYTNWYEEKLTQHKIKKISGFVREISKDSDGLINCKILGNEVFTAKKLVFCSGAYAKLFSQYFPETKLIENTQIVAGSYLERSVDLKCDSFYFTIGDSNIIYRSEDHKLIVGSVSSEGAVLVADIEGLRKILIMVQEKINLDLGSFLDFQIKTGLRHKGNKRRPIFRALDDEKCLFLISGFYKNGYTLGHLSAEVIKSQL